jgi:uncharacterized membrane protein YeaQ/YmgE (transglycosylase-associated protein family)
VRLQRFRTFNDQDWERRVEQAIGGVVGGTIGLLLVLAIGLIIGVTAKLLLPGKDPGGWFMTILLGIGGSWIGGVIATLLGISAMVPLFIAAVLGAMLLLLIYRWRKGT